MLHCLRFFATTSGVIMAVIDFHDLQVLSGYKQPTRVIDWLKQNGVSFVVGGDGKPRTTSDLLQGT